MRYCINKNGCRINIICASCKYKFFDKKYDRRCTLMPGVEEVLSDGHCMDWEMSEGMKNVGDKKKAAPKLRDLTERLTAFREEYQMREKMEKEIKYEKLKEKKQRLRTIIKSKKLCKVYSLKV